MTDIQNSEPDIEDRASNIRITVQHIINRKCEEMFTEFDRLHRRGIHDNDMVEALTYLEEKDILEGYADWAEIDLREDDNTTTSPDWVTDPGDSETNRQMAAALDVKVPNPAVIDTVEKLALLNDGVILALKGGGAGQVRRNDDFHALFLAGSDIWEQIMQLNNDDEWEIVDAAGRRTLAQFLPAVALGVAK